MTNAEIILRESVALCERGIIDTTGRMLTMRKDDGTEDTIPEPEPIHTFQAWKELGYCVKRGEHAIAKFAIWKPARRKKEDEESEGEERRERMFLKTAHFFRRAQVEPMTEVDNGAV